MKKQTIKPHIFPFFILLFLVILILWILIYIKFDTQKNLWTHLVFIDAKILGKKVYKRNPVIIYGLFNQLFALFTAADLAKLLGRNLVISNFYVNFVNTKNIVPHEGMHLDSVPLSKIIDLNTIIVPTKDWNHKYTPVPSKIFTHPVDRPPNAIDILKQESDVQNLEIGCCFKFPLPDHIPDRHIQKLRFHPIFYEIISPFLNTYPKYQVVHYRLENDFSNHFYQEYNFNNTKEFRLYYFQLYQDALKKNFDPKIPTLVVSYYYKDPKQQRDHDLIWDNLVHFQITPQQKSKLCSHLQLSISTPMREIYAIIDFVLCTSENVCSFIGIEQSTFSESVCHFRKNHKCFTVQPLKNA